MNNLAVILYVCLGAALGHGTSVTRAMTFASSSLALMLGLVVRTTSHYCRLTPA